MKGPKKPRLDPGYLIKFYKCPYCSDRFLKEDIDRHIREVCFPRHRREVRKRRSKMAKRHYDEGIILKHIPRKGESSDGNKET